MKYKPSPALRQLFAKKWITILIVSLLLVLFGRLLDNKSLSQSGIVIGIGVDYKDDLFIVSTQSVSIKGSAAGGQPSQNYVNCSAKAETIIEALDEISQKLGLIVSLSHCNVVILSPAVLKMDYLQIMYPLVKSMSLPEQAVVISTAENPAKLLAQPIATQETSAFLTQTTLLTNLGNDGLARLSVKDLIANSLSKSEAVRVPYAKIIKPEEQPISNSSSDTEYVEIVMTDNLVIKGDKSFVLPSRLAKYLNLYLIPKTEDKFDIEMPTGEIIAFRILNQSYKTKVDDLKVNYTSKLTMSFVEAQNVSGNNAINCASEIVLQAAALLEKKLEAGLTECYAVSRAQDIDFLMLQNKVYQQQGRSFKSDCFQDIDFTVDYQISVKENN